MVNNNTASAPFPGDDGKNTIDTTAVQSPSPGSAADVHTAPDSSPTRAMPTASDTQAMPTSRMPLHSTHLRHTATAIPVQAAYPRRAQAGQARSIRDGTSIQGIRNIDAAGRGYTIKKAPTP